MCCIVASILFFYFLFLIISFHIFSFFFFFNDTATTEIYTLSLHDALPISGLDPAIQIHMTGSQRALELRLDDSRSEEHTSELQSHLNLVCRLLLEKKKKTHISIRQGRERALRISGVRPDSHRARNRWSTAR